MDGNSNESLTVDMGNPSFDENLNDAMIEKIVETNENSRNRGEEQYVLYRKVTTTASTPVIDGASCSDQTSCSATLRNQSLSLSPSEVGIGIDDYSPHRDLQMNGGAADTGSASIVKISTNSVASGDDDDRGAEADFFDAVAGILADDDMVGDPVDSQELLNRRENNDFLDGMPHSDELNTADILLNHDQPFDHSPCEIDRTLEEAEDELLALLGTDSFLSSELIFPAVRESQFDAISHEVSPCVATITYSNEDFDQRDIDIYRKYEEVMEKSISETRRQDISTMGSALATIASFPPGSGPSTPVKHNKIAAGGELVPSPLADALERSSPEDSTITGLQENTRQLIGDALGDGPSRETEEPDVILFQSTTYPWDALGSGPSIPVKGGETGVQAGRNACLPENIPDLPTNAIDSDFPAERLKLPGSHETFKSHDCDGPMIGQAIDNILDYETPQHVSMTTDWVGGTSVSGLSVSKGNGDACIQAEIDASLRDSIPTKSSSTCSSPENMSVTEKDIKLESQGIDRKIIGDIPVNVPRCETLQQDSGTAESVINAPGAPVLRMSAPMKDENAGVKAEAIATSLDRLSVFALDAPGCAQPQSSILLGHHQDVESEENGRQITNDVTVNMPRYETQQYDSVTVDSSISASDRHVSGLTSSKNEDDDDAVADSSYPGVLSTLPTDLHDGDFRDGPAIPERQEFQDYGGQPTDGAVDYMSCDPRQQVTCAAVGASDSPGSGPSISEYSHDTMAETKPRGIPEACLSLSAGILDSDPPESPPLSGKLRAHISQDNRGRITSDDIPSCDTQQRVSGPTDSVVKSLDVPGSDSSSSVIFEKSFVESDPDSAVADELPTGALNSDLPKVATVSKRQELLESQNSEKLVTPSCETELLEIKPTDSVSPKSDSLSSGLSAPTEGSSQVALDVSCLDGLPSSLTDTLESELQNKSPESTTHESIDSRACNCRITGAANCYIPGRDAQEENPVTTVSVVDSANCNVLGLSSPFEVDDLAAISEPDAFLREGRPALSTDTLDIDLSEKSSIPDNDKASETQDIDCQSKDGAIDHIPHSGMGQQNRKANYLSSYAVSSGPSTPVRGDHSFTRDILDTSLPHGLVDLSNDFELDVGRSKTEMHETRKEEETGNDTCNTPSPSQLHFSVTATSVTTVPDAPDSGLSTPLKGDDATVETKTYSSLPRDLPDSSPVNLNIYSLERSEVPEYFDKRYDIEGENAGFICNANFDTSCSSLQLQDKPDDSTCIESDDSKTKSTPVKGTTCTVTAAEPNSVIPNARPCSVTKSMDDCLPRSSDTCDDSAATTDEHRSEAEGQDILASNSTVDLTESDKSPDHPSLNGSAVPLLSSGGGCESFCETRKPGFVDNASTSSYDSRRADSQGAAPTTGSGATDVLETHLVHSKVEIPEADNDAFLILDTFENGTNEQADDGGKVATTPYHVWDQMTWAETPEQGRSSEKEAMSQSGEESALPYHFLCVVDDDQVSGEPMHINPDDRSQGEAVPIPSALHCLPGGGRQAGTASAQARSTADEVVDLCSEIDTTNTLDDNSSCSIVTPTLFETPHIAPQSHRQGSLSCSDGLEAMNSQSTLDSTKSIRAMLQRELESLGFTNPLELPSLAGDEDMLGDNLCRNVAADENTPVKATGPEYWPLSNEKERRRVTLMPADYASADDSYCVEAQPHTSISVNLEELGDETKGFSGIKMDSPIPTVAGHVVGVVKRLEKSELDIARKECTMVNYENGPGEADPLNSDEGSTDRRAESTPKDGRIDFIPFPTQGKELYKNPDDLIDFLSRKLVAQKASDNVDSSGKQKGATLALFHASSSVFANEDDTWGSLLLSPPGSPVEPSYARDDSDSVDSSSQGSEIERSAGVLLFPPELCVWDMIADHSILSHSHPEYVLLPDHPRRSTTVGNQRSDDIAPLDLPGKKASGPAMTAAPGEIFRPSITHSRPSIVKRESFASLGSRKRMSLKTVIPHSEKLSRFWRRKGQVPALPLVKSEEIPPTTDRPENEEQETLSLGAEPKKNCGFPHFGSDQIHKSFSSNDLPGFGSNQTEGEIGLVENLPYSTTIAFETSRRKSLPPGMKASFPSPSSHRRNLSEHIFGTSEANGASPYVCIEMTKEFSLFPRFDDDLSDPPGHDEIDLEEDLTRFSSVEHLEFPFQYDLPCHARFYAALRWQQIISCWQHEEIAKSLFKGHYLNHGKSCNTETESIDDTCLTSRRTPVNEDHETMNVNGTLLPYITGADRANLVRTDSMTFSSFSRYFYVTRDCIDTDSLKHNLQQNVTDEAENLIALAKSHCADFAEIVEDVVRFAKQNFESVALGEDYDELDQIRFVTGVKEKLALEKKAKRKYGGDVLQVRDVLRASVVFPSEGSLVCGLIRLSLIEKDTTRRIKVEIVRVKNLLAFESPLETMAKSPLPTGYRHVLVNIRLNGGILAGKSPNVKILLQPGVLTVLLKQKYNATYLRCIGLWVRRDMLCITS